MTRKVSVEHLFLASQFFHGLPFVLSGLALVFSRRYSAWLGWVGVVVGAGSLTAGVMMFLEVNVVPGWLFIVFPFVVSVWMAALGILMWTRPCQRVAPQKWIQ